MHLRQFKDIFDDYNVFITSEVVLLFSFEHGHRIETKNNINHLMEEELSKIAEAIQEYTKRKSHRDQLVEEIVDYAFHLSGESELEELLAQVEEIKGISSSLIVEKLSERSPAFLTNRLHEILQNIKERNSIR